MVMKVGYRNDEGTKGEGTMGEELGTKGEGECR